MKAKLYITRAIKISAFILLSALVIGFLQEYVLCHHDANRMRLDAFYIEDKDTIDVAMIGSSEMYSGVSPALLYEKYGVTSFPYATASSTAAAMKTQIKEVERNQSPKLIVIEINCFLYGTDNEEKESSIRNYIDNVPLNGNKIEYIETTPAVRDLGRREFYFPIIKYHGVWNDFPEPWNKMTSRFTQDMRGYTYLRGYKTTAQKLNVNEKIYNPTLPADETRNDLDPRYEVFLREFLDYCKEQKYDNLLFVRFPHIVKKETYKRFTRGNAAFDIISEYGFNYINFERDENVMSYTADDYYNYDHLNIYGSVKFTDYFGKIITEKYKVPKTVLDEKNTEQWNESVDFWHKFYDYTEYRFKQNTKNKKIELWETNDLINKVEAYAAKQK
jgi:hypothetical protein